MMATISQTTINNILAHLENNAPRGRTSEAFKYYSNSFPSKLSCSDRNHYYLNLRIDGGYIYWDKSAIPHVD